MVALYILAVSIVILFWYVFLKVWLRKSFLFQVYFVTGVAMILTAILFFAAGELGTLHLFWAVPLALFVNVISYIYGVNHTRGSFRDVIEAIREMGKGNMIVSIAPEILERKDEIGELANVTSGTAQIVGEAMHSLGSGIENINGACKQLNITTQHLSQSANQQAESVGEVSASMEQMTANIEQNSSNSSETEKIASHAAIRIEENKNAVEVTVQSMNEIAKKINIINDIAFQTNILALNAAVEASHAGMHGRGFAVVAAEVRKLAENSKFAADEIDRLSKSGVAIAQKAGKQLDEIVPEIQKTAKLLLEISSASKEQRAGSDQINQAVQHLNGIMQGNASSSEELTASVDELVTYAETLSKKLSFFNFSGESAHKPQKTIIEKPVPNTHIDESHRKTVTHATQASANHATTHTSHVNRTSKEKREPVTKKGFDIKLHDKQKTDDQYESF